MSVKLQRYPGAPTRLFPLSRASIRGRGTRTTTFCIVLRPGSRSPRLLNSWEPRVAASDQPAGSLPRQAVPCRQARRLVVAFARKGRNGSDDDSLDSDDDPYAYVAAMLRGEQPSHVPGAPQQQLAWVPFRGALYLPLWLPGGHNEWWRIRRVPVAPWPPPPPPRPVVAAVQAAAAAPAPTATAQVGAAAEGDEAWLLTQQPLGRQQVGQRQAGQVEEEQRLQQQDGAGGASNSAAVAAEEGRQFEASREGLEREEAALEDRGAPKGSLFMRGSAIPYRDSPAPSSPSDTADEAAAVASDGEAEPATLKRSLFMRGSAIPYRDPPAPPSPSDTADEASDGEAEPAAPKRSLFMRGSAIPYRDPPAPPSPSDTADEASDVEAEPAAPKRSLFMRGSAIPYRDPPAPPSLLAVSIDTAAGSSGSEPDEKPRSLPEGPRKSLFMRGTAIPYREPPPPPQQQQALVSTDEASAASDQDGEAEPPAPKRSLFMRGTAIPYRDPPPPPSPSASSDVATAATTSDGEPPDPAAPKRSLFMRGAAIPYRTLPASPDDATRHAPAQGSASRPDSVTAQAAPLGLEWRPPQPAPAPAPQPPAGSGPAPPPPPAPPGPAAAAPSAAVLGQGTGEPAGQGPAAPPGGSWRLGRAGPSDAAVGSHQVVPPPLPHQVSRLGAQGAQRGEAARPMAEGGKVPQAPSPPPQQQPSQAPQYGQPGEPAVQTPSDSAAQRVTAPAEGPPAPRLPGGFGAVWEAYQRAVLAGQVPQQAPQKLRPLPGVPQRPPVPMTGARQVQDQGEGQPTQAPPSKNQGQGQGPGQVQLGMPPRTAPYLQRQEQQQPAVPLPQAQAQQQQPGARPPPPPQAPSGKRELPWGADMPSTPRAEGASLAQGAQSATASREAVGLPGSTPPVPRQKREMPWGGSPASVDAEPRLPPSTQPPSTQPPSTQPPSTQPPRAQPAMSRGQGREIPWGTAAAAPGLEGELPGATAPTTGQKQEQLPSSGSCQAAADTTAAPPCEPPANGGGSAGAVAPVTAPAAQSCRGELVAGAPTSDAASRDAGRDDPRANQRDEGRSARATADGPSRAGGKGKQRAPAAVARSAAAPLGGRVVPRGRSYEWELSVSCHDASCQQAERLIRWTRVCPLPGGDMTLGSAVLAAEQRLRTLSSLSRHPVEDGEATPSLDEDEDGSIDGLRRSTSAGGAADADDDAVAEAAAATAEALGAARAASSVTVTAGAMSSALRRATLSDVRRRAPSAAQQSLLQRLVRRRRMDTLDPAVFLAVCPGSLRGGPGSDRDLPSDVSLSVSSTWDEGSDVSTAAESGSGSSSSGESADGEGVTALREEDSGGGSGDSTDGRSSETPGPAGTAVSKPERATPGLLLHHLLAIQALEDAAENAAEADAAAAAAAAGLPPPITRRQLGFVRTLLKRAARGVDSDTGQWLRGVFRGAVPERRLRRLVEELVGEEYGSAAGMGAYGTDCDMEAAEYMYGQMELAAAQAAAEAKARGVRARAARRDPLEELMGSLSREHAKQVIDRLQKQVARLPRQDW